MQATTRPKRPIRHDDRVPQSRPDSRDAHRVKCGGGYRVIRKTIPGS
jgi:hypothetical protein